MLDFVYRKRVERDLPGWVAKGWVRPECADPLLRSIPGGDLRERLPLIVAMFGAVLLVLGALSFVAANWNELSRLLRLGLLFGALWAAYGGAMWLKSRHWTVLYEAAVVLGCGIFGANIMLVAQMYHIDRHYPDGVMIWAVGTLLAAGLSRSVAAVVFGFALLTYWTGSETIDFEVAVHWQFLILWFAAAWLVWYERWTLGVNAAALALFAWATFATIAIADRHAWNSGVPVAATLSLCSVFAVAIAARFEARIEARDGDIRRAFSSQALVGLFTLFFILQTMLGDFGPAGSTSPDFAIDRSHTQLTLGSALIAAAGIALSIRPTALLPRDAAALATTVVVCLAVTLAPLGVTVSFILLATAYFGLAVWVITYGQRRQHGAAINLGFAAFGVEALYFYFRTIGSLLNTALFFLAGGVALVVLAVVLERLRRRLLTSTDLPTEQLA